MYKIKSHMEDWGTTRYVVLRRIKWLFWHMWVYIDEYYTLSAAERCIETMKKAKEFNKNSKPKIYR